MIIYSFECDAHHIFEVWFSSAEDCDQQLEAEQLSCPTCHSTDVTKQLAAPAVHDSERAQIPIDAQKLSARQAAIQHQAREVAAFVHRHFVNVGNQFARQAWLLHESNPDNALDNARSEGDTDKVGICGNASALELKGLREANITFSVLNKPDRRQEN